MPRPSRPWYRKSRMDWHVTIGGKQIPLGVTDPNDLPAAMAAMHRILTAMGTDPPVNPPPRPTVAEAAARFLAGCEARDLAPVTIQGYRVHLDMLTAAVGDRRLDAMTAEDFEATARRPRWNDTTRALYLSTVEAMLKHAGIKLKLRKPAKLSRGADAVIPPEVYERLLLVAVGDWRQIIRFLWHTGCRPGEAAKLTADMLTSDGRVFILKQHKTARHGKKRQIVLDDEAATVVQGQLKKHGGGLLFRGKQGKPFSRHAFVMKMIRLSARVGHPVTAYGFRHTYATRGLVSGVPEPVVAALLGHSSTAMVNRHYGHVGSNMQVLRAAAEKIAGKAA